MKSFHSVQCQPEAESEALDLCESLWGTEGLHETVSFKKTMECV